MSVLDTLTREHKLFHGLVERLERALRFDEDSARGELQKLLLLLLPALEKHEEIEDIVFGPPYDSSSGARDILTEIGAQHRKIEAIKEELQEALRDVSNCPFRPLSALVEQLAQKLKIHFATEESRLWPHYRDAASRSLNGSIERRAREKVKVLERDVVRQSELIADYLGRSR